MVDRYRTTDSPRLTQVSRGLFLCHDYSGRILMYVATDLTSSSHIYLLCSNADLDINAQQFPYLRQRLTRR